eukprot:12346149-Karenia_brevis.AAC.1
MKGVPSWANRARAKLSLSKRAAARPSWATRAATVKKRPASKGEPADEAQPKHRAWTEHELASKLHVTTLPAWWVTLVLACATLAAQQTILHGVEFFSGEGELTAAFCLLVGPFACYDIKHGRLHDILEDDGLRSAVVLLLRVASGGYVHFGTPCKSWVTLSRSWTQRSLLRPAGPPASKLKPAQAKYLESHNRIATYTAYLIKTARALGIEFTIEQPTSSLLFSFKDISLALT